MSINLQVVIEKMLFAAEGVFKDRWPAIRDHVTSETKIFAERLATIERLRLSKSISENRARSHIEFQKEAWETFLLSVEGMNQLIVEEALNAAIEAIKDIVNGALKFALL